MDNTGSDINNASGKIRPAGSFSREMFLILRIAIGLGIILILPFKQELQFSGIANILSGWVTKGVLVIVWALFAYFLRSFSGTEKIRRMIFYMNIASCLLICALVFFFFSGYDFRSYTRLTVTILFPFISMVFYLAAAILMIRTGDRSIKLRLLGWCAIVGVSGRMLLSATTTALPEFMLVGSFLHRLSVAPFYILPLGMMYVTLARGEKVLAAFRCESG